VLCVGPQLLENDGHWQSLLDYDSSKERMKKLLKIYLGKGRLGYNYDKNVKLLH
jgi:hypothetical protein